MNRLGPERGSGPGTETSNALGRGRSNRPSGGLPQPQEGRHEPVR
jgi:hypothetical protein